MAKAHKIIGVTPQGSYYENARIILPQKVEEVYTWEPFIRDESRRKELHNMRISIRRLRYAMEVFRVAYQTAVNAQRSETISNVLSEEQTRAIDITSTNSQYNEFLAIIVDLQEILGDIHDCDVVLETLVDYKSQLVNQGEQTVMFPGINTLIARARETRRADYKIFMEKWEHLSVTNFKQKLLSFLTS